MQKEVDEVEVQRERAHDADAVHGLAVHRPLGRRPALDLLRVVHRQPREDEDADEAAPAEDEGADEAAPAEDEETDEVASPDGASDAPVANALTYTGEVQALVSGEGFLFSLDGESFSAEAPTAVNAGEYTVYFKAAEDAEAQTLTVVVAKADVVFTPPEAATSEE